MNDMPLSSIREEGTAESRPRLGLAAPQGGLASATSVQSFA
jgi:hypothetical protein